MRRRLSQAIGVLGGLTLSLFSIHLSDALTIPIVPKGQLGPFRHGTYPSLGNRTHAGVDILAEEGTPIYPFADGTVVDVVDRNDHDFNQLGNAVILEHSVLPRRFYTLYLHMRAAPTVKKGDFVTGGKTIIGHVGKTGKANNVSHTHFEIRYFSERYSAWGNIYGPGDQRGSEYFKVNWEDPIVYFEKYPAGITKSAPDSSPEYSFRMKYGITKTGQFLRESITLESLSGIVTVPVKEIISFKQGELRLKDGSVIRAAIPQASHRGFYVQTKDGLSLLYLNDIAAISLGTLPEQGEEALGPGPTGGETGQPGSLPTHYGVFVVAGGKHYELSPELAEREIYILTYEKMRWWYMCCRNQPVQIPLAGNIELILFLRGMQNLKVTLFQFQFVRQLLHVDTPLPLYGPPTKRLDTPKGWFETGPISLTQSPIVGQPEMIRLEPKPPLNPGIYGLRVEMPFQTYPERGVLVFGIGVDTTARERFCFDWKVETAMGRDGWTFTMSRCP